MPLPATLLWIVGAPLITYGAKKLYDAITDDDDCDYDYTTRTGPSREELREEHRQQILADIQKIATDFVYSNEGIIAVDNEVACSQIKDLYQQVCTGKTSSDQAFEIVESLIRDENKFEISRSFSRALIDNIDKCKNLSNFIKLVNANSNNLKLAIIYDYPLLDFYSQANLLSGIVNNLTKENLPKHTPRPNEELLPKEFCPKFVKDFNEAILIASANQHKEPRVVVCGLLKAGKSSLLNSLFNNINDDLFAIGRTRKTAKNQIENNNGISFIDTPGTDANEQDTQEAYEAYIISDLLLFVHNGERALVSQEIDMLKKIPMSKEELEAKLEIVVTNSDLSYEHIEELKKSISEQIQENFGFTKEIHFVSNKFYKKEKLRSHSGIDELRSFIFEKIEANKELLCERREQALLNAIEKIKLDNSNFLQRNFNELNSIYGLPIENYSDLSIDVINKKLDDDYKALYSNLLHLVNEYRNV